MPSRCWNSSKRVTPRNASRTISNDHHSPTASRHWATEQCISEKLLRSTSEFYHRTLAAVRRPRFERLPSRARLTVVNRSIEVPAYQPEEEARLDPARTAPVVIDIISALDPFDLESSLRQTAFVF